MVRIFKTEKGFETCPEERAKKFEIEENWQKQWSITRPDFHLPASNNPYKKERLLQILDDYVKSYEIMIRKLNDIIIEISSEENKGYTSPNEIDEKEKKILEVLLSHNRYLSTSEVVHKSGISWNTALILLRTFHQKTWIRKKYWGNRVLWKGV